LTQLFGSLGIVATVHFVVVGWTFGKQARKKASKKKSKKESKKARKKASKRQRKQASNKASNKISKKQARKQASKQSKQASNQARKQPRKKESKSLCGACPLQQLDIWKFGHWLLSHQNQHQNISNQKVLSYQNTSSLNS
jgi:FtsZ-interacting cell division protein ZipA